MTELRLDDIEVRERSRVAIGNIDSLAASIRDRGLLHPPVVRRDGEAWVLVAGQRRIEAARLLGWSKVTVTVAENAADEASALRAEGEENTEREPFTPEEAVRHRKRIESVEVASAEVRQREGQERGRAARQGKLVGSNLEPTKVAGRKAERCSNLEPLSATTKPTQGKTRHRTAVGTGYSATTVDKAEAVVEAAEKNPELRPLVDEMNRTRKVDSAYQKVKQQELRAEAAAMENLMDRAIAKHKPEAVSAQKRNRLRTRFMRAVAISSDLVLIDADDLVSVLTATEIKAWQAQFALLSRWAEKVEKACNGKPLRVVQGGKS